MYGAVVPVVDEISTHCVPKVRLVAFVIEPLLGFAAVPLSARHSCTR